jgi:membrane protein
MRYMSFSYLFRLIVNIMRRFRGERLAQTAAALSFATLLGLVPMIVVFGSLVNYLPFADRITTVLERFLLANLLPDKAGAVIANVVEQFANRAESLTLIGVVALAITALMQMLTIEHAFNAIWKTRASSFLPRRIAMHVLVLLLGPLIFAAGLMGIAYLISASMGLVGDISWFRFVAWRSFSFLLMTLLLTLAYWRIPNRKVFVRYALVGGVLATASLLTMQKMFALYIVQFPTYTLIYGPFAALPIFLAWLYASWTIILLGALIAAELPDTAKS